MDLTTKLLHRVTEMFLRFGIKSVSMDDISRDLGISKKTLYCMVPNKAKLVSDILHRFIEEEEAQVAVIDSQAKDPIHEMVLIAKHVTRMLKKLSPNTLYDLKKYYLEAWREMETSRNDMIFRNIKRNLETGIKHGLYRDDLNVDLLSTLYVRMATYIVDQKIMDITREQKINLYIEFIKYHIRGIATTKGMKVLKNYEHLLNED